MQDHKRPATPKAGDESKIIPLFDPKRTHPLLIEAAELRHRADRIERAALPLLLSCVDLLPLEAQAELSEAIRRTQ